MNILRETETGRELISLPVGSKPRSFAASPDGFRVAASTEDGTVFIWNPLDWRNTVTLQKTPTK